jgi:hypothetical protein
MEKIVDARSARIAEKWWIIANAACGVGGVILSIVLENRYPTLGALAWLVCIIPLLSLPKLIFYLTGWDQLRLAGNLRKNLASLKPRLETHVSASMLKHRMPKLDYFQEELDRIGKYSKNDQEVIEMQQYIDKARVTAQEYSSMLPEQMRDLKYGSEDLWQILTSHKSATDYIARLALIIGLGMVLYNFCLEPQANVTGAFGILLQFIALTILLRKFSIIIAMGGGFLLAAILFLFAAGMGSLMRVIQKAIGG